MQTIDYLSPQIRPDQPVEMRPVWRHLLFLHWVVDPAQLRRQLPPGLELDLFEGKAYVGLVPFTMAKVRPRWVPPWRRLTDFHEINVRTYVHLAGRDPGVWFFSLDAASAPAVVAARIWFKLPYYWARMSLRESGGRVDYHSERRWPHQLPASCDVSYSPNGVPTPAVPGTLEHFLVERYFLYSYAHSQLFSGHIHHAPYEIQPAHLHTLSENLLSAAGIERGEEPPLVHYAREVRTEIFKLRPARSAGGEIENNPRR